MPDGAPIDDGLHGSSNRYAELISDARRLAAGIRRKAPDGSTAVAPFAGPPPDSFTGYTILREVHRGGQGVVYQAVQESTSRKVAIKVLREGPFASEADRARFKREVEILGQLNHPSIVAIHDTGVAAGHHFLVMDYISGQPLDVYMASGERSIDETLQLFATICDAVNAAHLRGIIHRDLKPSNVRIDVEGVPHVLDFGLAKVCHSGPPLGTQPGAAGPQVMTLTGQFVGSLPWAAPEQAEGVPSNIDVRTDVYSLGVILYQMLTHRFPYEVVGNMPDVLDRIMHAEPVRPSTLRPGINDEVETIVLKCLQKENDRRYQSAGELARDVRRYLDGEPIEAKRDSTAYVFRKQLRKHWVPVAIAAAFVFVVTAGFVTSLAFWRQAVADRNAAIAAQTKEAEARAQARQEADAAQEISNFFTSMLAAVDPMALREISGLVPEDPALTGARSQFQRDVSVAEMLGPAGEQIDVRFADKPDLRAMAHETVGMTFFSLWRYRDAESHLREALAVRRESLGEEHEDTLRSELQLAYLLWKYTKGHRLEAENLARSAYEGLLGRRGLDHRNTLTAARVYGLVLAERGRVKESEDLLEDTLNRQRALLGNAHPDTLGTMLDWIYPLFYAGKLKHSWQLMHELHEISLATRGPDDQITLRADWGLGFLDGLAGRHDQAEDRLRQCWERCKSNLGPDHPFTIAAMSLVAANLSGEEGLAQAEELYTNALEVLTQEYGNAEQVVHDILGKYLPTVLANQGPHRYDEAVAHSRRAYDIAVEEIGGFHYRVTHQGRLYLQLLNRTGRTETAHEFAREHLQRLAALPDAENPHPLALMGYANALLSLPFEDLRDPQRAVHAARRAVDITEHQAPWCLWTLAYAYQANGQLEQALVSLREALEVYPPGDWRERTQISFGLSDMLREAGEDQEAEAILNDIVAQTQAAHGDAQAELVQRLVDLRQCLPPDDRGASSYVALQVHQALRGMRPDPDGRLPEINSLVVAPRVSEMVVWLMDDGRFREAERLLRAELRVQEVSLPAGNWRIFETMSLLGAALAGQGRFDEAEPLLLDAHQQMKDDPETPPERIAHAVERIVALYDASDRPAEAGEWRARLTALDTATGDENSSETPLSKEDTP